MGWGEHHVNEDPRMMSIDDPAMVPLANQVAFSQLMSPYGQSSNTPEFSCAPWSFWSEPDLFHASCCEPMISDQRTNNSSTDAGSATGSSEDLSIDNISSDGSVDLSHEAYAACLGTP